MSLRGIENRIPWQKMIHFGGGNVSGRQKYEFLLTDAIAYQIFTFLTDAIAYQIFTFLTDAIAYQIFTFLTDAIAYQILAGPPWRA